MRGVGFSQGQAIEQLNGIQILRSFYAPRFFVDANESEPM